MSHGLDDPRPIAPAGSRGSGNQPARDTSPAPAPSPRPDALLGRLLRLSSDVAGEREPAVVAQHIADCVVETTEFRAATVTVRAPEGEACERLAVAGAQTRLGASPPLPAWRDLLADAEPLGSLSHLVPPERGRASWGERTQHDDPQAGGPDAWSPDHGLVCVLRDGDGDEIGFVSLDAPRSGRLPGPEDIEWLELVAHQAQAALRNVRLYAQLHASRQVAETLRDVGLAVTQSLELADTLRICADAAAGHSVGDRASLLLTEDEGATFRPVMSRGPEDPDLWQRFRALDPLRGADLPTFQRALASEEPVTIPDTADPRLGVAERITLDAFGVRSAVLYPLHTRGSKLGVMLVDARERVTAFPEPETDLLSRIADHAAVAIRHAQLHQEVRDRAARIADLHELTTAMLETLDFDAVFERVSAAVRERMPATSVSVFEVTGAEARLLSSDLDDGTAPGQAALPFWRVPLDSSLAALLDRIRTQGRARVDEIAEVPSLGDVTLPETRSLLFAGHLPEDATRAHGLQIVAAAGAEQPGAFTDTHAEELAELTQATALALRNARLYEEAREAAERDSLTGLHNRRVFWRELGDHLAEATAGQPLSLALVDIDDYKEINDHHGHDVGDRLLAHVADRLARATRETDGVYRLGGDEFTIAMPGADRDDAEQVLRRCAAAMERTRYPGLPTVTLSAGLALSPEHGTDAETLFRAADRALYTAKTGGKARLAASGEPTSRPLHGTGEDSAVGSA